MTGSSRGTFGELLRNHRVAAGLSQGELAQRARISVRRVRALERGIESARYRDTVAQLLEALELEPEERTALEAALRPPGSLHVTSRPRGGPRTDVLVATKVTVPTCRPDLAPRSRLMDRLHSAFMGKLTLVAAPAGFGKTTLLTAWHATGSKDAPQLAWVSLDPGDNDQVRFWRYVITALERVHPGVGVESLALLQLPQTVPIQHVLTALVNAFANLHRDIVLVLDDYHLIEERAIHGAVTFLIDHLPQGLHLAIVTRDDPPFPLARLRAQGQLAEIRAADLRFTIEETSRFLNEVMGLRLTDQHVQALEMRTEGWIAGLQLAALAMRNRGDVERFVASFTGSSRYVADYLIEEVVLGQPEEIQGFLLRTAILDRMCAPLCDAVMQWDDGSQAVLERLERADLFVIALDDEGQWYRYHHLFAEMLRHRLRRTDAALIPKLHRMASVWFEQNNLVAQAVDHALVSSDMQRAGSLIQENALPTMLRGQVQTVLGWLNALPDELVRSQASLCIAHAVALMFVGRMDASEARLADAERCVEVGMPDDEARSVLGTAAVIRANMAQFRGDRASFVALSREALDLLPMAEGPVWAAAQGGASCDYLVSGDVTSGPEQRLTRALAATRAAGDLMASLTGLTHIARFQVMQGRLRQAAATYKEASQLSTEYDGSRTLAGTAAYFFGLGDVLREWNDLETAERHVQHGMDLVGGAVHVSADHLLLGYGALALLQQARGEFESALATIEDFARLAGERQFVASLTLRAATLAAGVHLSRGNLVGAARWAEASGLTADDEPSFPQETEYLTLARILIAQRTAPLEGAAAPLHGALCLLDRLLLGAEAAGRMGSVIEIQILRALALHASGKNDQAMQALERALALAEPEGYVRIFVDEGSPLASLLSAWVHEHAGDEDQNPHRRALLLYGQRLIAAYGQQSAAGSEAVADSPSGGTVEPLFEPLTDRELAVLRLLAAGLANREIGAELYLSLNTVKWYVKSLYSKLGVQSRTQAVARAHALHLIPA